MSAVATCKPRRRQFYAGECTIAIQLLE